ncbi:MAG: MOSC N-terminal beta barrel domain-containing protein [Gemmatales bacterium]|nr:MOSC N-terminal beta barrel domain-containing protein [Gemmatales bacterium]MDW7995230.1 MOSC N-terminal beta barrel domain-containing protein [Gemmatales bacterium]
MAVLSCITIFPIKSLDGVERQEVTLLPTGPIAGDRRWALVDEQGKFVNGKRHAAVHRLRAKFSDDLRRVCFRVEGASRWHEFDLEKQRSELEGWLSQYFGFRVFLRTNATIGFPDDVEAPGPTVVAEASLREVGAYFGWSLPEVRARFRANLEISGTEPFWEDRLYGQAGEVVRFRIGEVILEGTNPCRRCVVPSRNPWTGEVMPEFAKRFADWRRTNLPAWAERSRFQDTFYRFVVNTRLVLEGAGRTLRVGDEVTLVEKLPR